MFDEKALNTSNSRLVVKKNRYYIEEVDGADRRSGSRRNSSRSGRQSTEPNKRPSVEVKTVTFAPNNITNQVSRSLVMKPATPERKTILTNKNKFVSPQQSEHYPNPFDSAYNSPRDFGIPSFSSPGRSAILSKIFLLVI